MGKFFLDTGITLSNQAWRLTGKRSAGKPGLRLELPDAPLAEMCAATLREVHDRVAFPFGVRFRSRWVRATHDAASADSTESAFASLLLRFTDPALAREAIRVFFFNRSLEGRMPLEIQPFNTSSLPAYPFVLLALVKFNEITGDSEGTRELFLKYLKFSDWLVITHKGDGGLYFHNDEKWFRHDFLVRPLVEAAPEAASRWREVQSLGLNCIMAYQYRLMGRCAIGGGETRDARKLDNHAKKLATFIHETFWNQEHQFYFDKLGGEPVLTPTAVGLLPLVAETPTRTQAEAMVTRLDDVTAPLFRTLDQVPCNAVLAFLIMEGLAKYGFHHKASALALRLARAAASLQGTEGSLLARSVAVHALVKHVLGFVSMGPKRFVFFPKLPETWQGQSGRLSIKPHNVALDFTLDEQGGVRASVAHPYGADISLALPNFSFKPVDLEKPPAPPAPATPSEPDAPADKTPGGRAPAKTATRRPAPEFKRKPPLS